jgi:subfamily B ATP-binding cassette protein MsbA
MTLTDWRLAAIVVAFLAAASVISAYFGRPLPTLRKTIQSVEARFSARLHEVLGGIRTVKSFGRERYEAMRLDEVSAETTELEVREGRVAAMIDPLLELMEILGLVLIVWYGAYLIAARAITPGALVAFIVYMELLSEPVSAAGSFYRHFQSCRGVLQRIAEFLDEMPRDSNGLGRARPQGPMTVRFDAVSFRYPGTKRRAVDRVDFETQPGQLVGIAGRNGAGKSTLMDLLLGFRRPDEGRILIANCDVLMWDPDALREAIATMPQEVFLFNASVAENIRYGRLDATPEEIEAAAVAAGLGPLIEVLPAGLDTVIGDRGQNMSGGERQRVSLARLLLKNPRIIIFDEPTSGLDGGAVRDLSQTLVALARLRTVFVISHRPETLEHSTRIILLDAGCLAASGTHAELLATNAAYAALMQGPRRVRQV